MGVSNLTDFDRIKEVCLYRCIIADDMKKWLLGKGYHAKAMTPYSPTIYSEAGHCEIVGSVKYPVRHVHLDLANAEGAEYDKKKRFQAMCAEYFKLLKENNYEPLHPS